MNSSLLETVITVGGTLIGIYVKDYLDKKNSVKNKDLERDLETHKIMSATLDEIRLELGADKTLYWVFSNGDITFSGFHLKKLSVMEESSVDGFSNVAHSFQLVPAKNFEKHLLQLNESDEEYITLEVDNMPEELKDLYSLYEVKKVLKIKVKDSRGKWIGVLSAWYRENIELSDGQIAFAKIQASKIGSIK